MASPNGLSPVSTPSISKPLITRMSYPPAAQMLLPTTIREPSAIEACGGLYRPGAIAAAAHPYSAPYALQGNDRVFAHFSPELAAYYSRLSSLYGPNLKGCTETWNATLTHPAVNACYPCDAYQYYGDGYGAFDVNGARRKNATRETTSTLKAWLYEHRKNPYPTKGEKIMLAIITKMTLTQVSTWFANARRRLKKENKMTWSPRNRSEDGDDDGSKVGGDENQLTKEDVERLDLDVDHPEDKDGDDDDDVLDVESDEQRTKAEAELRERIGFVEHIDSDENSETLKRLTTAEHRHSPSGSDRCSPIMDDRIRQGGSQSDEPGSPGSRTKEDHFHYDRLRHSPHVHGETSDEPTPRKPKIWSLAETAISKDNHESHRRSIGHCVSRFHPYFPMHRPNAGPYSPPSSLAQRQSAEEHLRASVQNPWHRIPADINPLAYRWNGLGGSILVPTHPHPSTQDSKTALTTVVHSSSTPLVAPAPLRGTYAIHGKEVHVR